MQVVRRHRIFAALLGLLASSVVWSQGRVTVRVVDHDGRPVEAVSVSVRNQQLGYENEGKTNKKGKYSVMLVDPSQTYLFRFEKDGLVPLERLIMPTAGAWDQEEVTLAPISEATSVVTAQDVTGPTTTFNEGVEAYNAGDLATAEVRFLEAVEQDREMVEAYSALATLYLSQDEPDEAIPMAEALLELQSESLIAHEMLYDAYDRLGDEENARQHLEQIQQLAGGAGAAALRLFNMGVESAKSGDLADAEKVLLRALRLDPELAVGHSALAGVYHLQQKYDEALNAAGVAISLDSELIPAWRNMYQSQIKLGDEAGAGATLSHLTQVDPNGTAEMFTAEGTELFNQGKLSESRKAFEQALRANSSHVTAHYQLGLVLIQAGETAAAREHLSRLLELDPEHPDADTAREMIGYLGE